MVFKELIHSDLSISVRVADTGTADLLLSVLDYCF